MVSIIVPVFNSEKYIKRCILSVVNQTNPNWELIVVDDGSTDSSAEIISELSKNDIRIRYFYQSNKGAGMARNLGISKVKGDYIAFLDSDDYISKDYIEQIERNKADVIFLDSKRIETSGTKIESFSKYNKKSKNDLIRYQLTSAMPWGGWRKVVKKELVETNHIRYSAHRVGEEAVFSFQVLVSAKSLGFIDKPVYSYCVRSGSLSQSIDKDPWSNVCINIRKKSKEMQLYEEYADTINSFFVVATMVSIANMAKIYDWKEYKKKVVKKYKWMQKQIDWKHKIDFKHINIKAIPILLLIKIKCLFLLYFLCKHR